jgi:hypothetical protein
MTLFRMLMEFKEDGIVKGFDILEEGRKAKARLRNNESVIFAYLEDDYIIGVTSILEVTQNVPAPKYIVYSNWNQITRNAEEEAGRHGIRCVKYAQFRQILNKLSGRVI